MKEIQISMQDIVDKLRERVATDAQNMAIFEATISAYEIKVQEMYDEIMQLRAEERTVIND